MTVMDDVLHDLEQFHGCFPYEAFESIRADRLESTPILLSILQHVHKHYLSLSDDYIAHLFAMFLLAEFREPQAFLPVINLLHLPGRWPERLLGDVLLSYDTANVLASTYSGSPEHICDLIENQFANPYARSAGLEAMIALVATKQLSRMELMEYLSYLFDHGLPRQRSFIWTELVGVACDIYAEPLYDEMMKACREQLVDEALINPDYINNVMKAGEASTLKESVFRPYYLIKDAVTEMRGWHCFNHVGPVATNDAFFELGEAKTAVLPHQSLHPRIETTGFCYCGSGLLFKDCCW